MKQVYLSFFALVFALFISANVFAHDIEVKNADGVTIYYKWINDSTELAVSCRTVSDGSGGYYIYHEYTGNVVIPESVIYNGVAYSVTSIDADAFESCSGLLSVTIPRSVVSISSGIFAYSSNLTSIIVDAENPKYDSRENCNAVIETNTNTLIAGCSTASIPLSVTTIGENAFEGCQELTTVVIPANISSIGRNIFLGCGNLTTIMVDSENPKYDSRDNCNAIIETDSRKLITGCKNSTIPNSVKSIGEYAFFGCSGLTSVEIPDSIINIETSAFRKCGELLSVKIGTGVTIIEDNTFRDCNLLKTITIGSNVQEIKQGSLYSCNNLENIISLNTIPPTLSRNAFMSRFLARHSTIIHVPIGSLEAYSNADVWKNFTIIEGDFSNSNELHIIDALNFPDEKFREYLMNEPYGKDGVLTEEEISGITTLNVSNMGISDLKGIEYFTALKKLLCYKNNLTCLNLSANKQLNEVDCYSNQIMGIKMDSLLASLPTLSEGEGSLYVLDATDEGNICFTEQVSYAKSKGWIVYHYTGSDWQEYEGRESGIIINEDNFPDEEFRAFLIKQDYGKDLIITGDELTTIVSIDTQSYNYAWTASNGNIRTLKGIEYFTYLRYLNIAGNKIESLDISKNRQLQELDCTYNYLTELDVSQNTELTKLYCSGSFSKLDVSKNTKLTTLSFASMKLTEIDLSNNTALTDLSFDVTGLQSVDLSKNVALTKLSCIQNSSLTNLDVSKNKALTYLRCSESKLSTIDISKNTALTYLFCAYNQLTSLDVSKNGELTELACMGNQLTKLDVSKNLKLKTLKCQQNKINGERMYQLIESLPIQTSATLCVINLQVADENICTKDQVKKANEKGWKVMWGYEYYNSGPAGYHPHYYDYEGSDSEDIYIEEENFPDENFRAFLLEQSYGKDGVITAEERNNIKSLNVEGKYISSLKGIELFTKLAELNCSSNYISDLDLSKNTEIVILDCSSNRSLSNFDISNNTALKRLYCSYNQFTSLNISNNTELTILDCSENNLSNLDSSNNSALTHLRCDHNNLSNLDLSNNTVLISLECDDNNLSILDFSNNTALQYLSCNSNQITSLDISRNTTLREVHCSNNQLNRIELPNSTAMRGFYCDQNQLTSLDVSNSTALYYLFCSENLLTSLDLSKNTALTYLSVGRNQLTSLDVSKNTALKELYCWSNRLTNLDISNNNTLLTRLYIYSNKIKGDEMQAIVSNLPVQTDAELGVVDLSDESEGNVCTTSQVAIAKEKGWRVMATRGFGNVNYEGSDPSGIQGITLEKNPNAPVYDLNGRRLTEPAKGINIIGGKKVLKH